MFKRFDLRLMDAAYPRQDELYIGRWTHSQEEGGSTLECEVSINPREEARSLTHKLILRSDGGLYLQREGFKGRKRLTTIF